MKITIDDCLYCIDTVDEEYFFHNDFNSFYNFLKELLTDKQYIKFIGDDTARIFTVNDFLFNDLIKLYFN